MEASGNVKGKVLHNGEDLIDVLGGQRGVDIGGEGAVEGLVHPFKAKETQVYIVELLRTSYSLGEIGAE